MLGTIAVLFCLLSPISLDEPHSRLGLRAVLDEGNPLAVPVPGQEHVIWSLDLVDLSLCHLVAWTGYLVTWSGCLIDKAQCRATFDQM